MQRETGCLPLLPGELPCGEKVTVEIPVAHLNTVCAKIAEGRSFEKINDDGVKAYRVRSRLRVNSSWLRSNRGRDMRIGGYG